MQIERCFAAILDRGQRCCSVAVYPLLLLAYRPAIGLRKKRLPNEKTGFLSRDAYRGRAFRYLKNTGSLRPPR